MISICLVNASTVNAKTKKTKVTTFYLGVNGMESIDFKYKKTWSYKYWGYEVKNIRLSNNKVLKSVGAFGDADENKATIEVTAKHTGKVTVYADIVGWDEGYTNDKGEWIGERVETYLITVKKTVKFVKYKNPFKKFSIGKKDYRKQFNHKNLVGTTHVKKNVKGMLNVKLKKGFRFVSKKNGVRGGYEKERKFDEVFIRKKNIKNHKLFKTKFKKNRRLYIIDVDVYDKKNKMKMEFELWVCNF